MAERILAAADGMQASAQGRQTICARICALLEQVHRDNDHGPHVGAIMALADPLMDAAGSFTIYISALGERLIDRNYADALNVGRLMVQHEAMLLGIADKRPSNHLARLN